MEATLYWLGVVGSILLLGLIPALVVTAALTPPPDDDKPAPSMTDEV